MKGFLGAPFLSPGISEAYLAFHEKEKGLFLNMPASVKQHHAYIGGYAIHIDEVMANAYAMFNMLPTIQDYTLEDLLTAAYVHDLDKLLYRYELDREKPTGPQLKKARDEGVVVSAKENKTSLSAKIDAAVKGEQVDEKRLPYFQYREHAIITDDSAIVCHLMHQHGLPPLSLMALHAVSVHHGGWSGLARSTNRLKIEPIGALLHAADLISANSQRGDVVWP